MQSPHNAEKEAGVNQTATQISIREGKKTKRSSLQRNIHRRASEQPGRFSILSSTGPLEGDNLP